MEKYEPTTVEHQEQKEEPPEIKTIVFSDHVALGRSMKKVLRSFKKTREAEYIGDRKELKKELEGDETDVVLVDHQDKDEIIRAITEIRNDPKVNEQPVVIVVDRLKQMSKILDKSGADVVISGIEALQLASLLSKIDSVPELLGKVEDAYGDKMLINKQQFYKKFQDKLMARSELTADTEQELELLQQIFKDNKVKDILDAGGGEGRIAIPLADQGYNITNTDATLDLIKKQRNKNQKIESAQADLKELPFQKESFDAVTYNWHVFCDILGNKSKRAILAEANRVLRPNGIVVLDIPDRDIYEEIRHVVDPELLTDRDRMIRERDDLIKDFNKLKDDPSSEEDKKLAKSVLLQGINFLNTELGEETRLVADPEHIEEENYYNVGKVDFKSDGIYITPHDGGENTFIGYVPSVNEVKTFLNEAGFKDIEVKRWKTKKGFYKVSFIAKK